MGLYLPLRVRDRVIGVLEVYGPEALGEEGPRRPCSAWPTRPRARWRTPGSTRSWPSARRRLHDTWCGELITAQEEERRRVAYDVHDGLAQTAAAAYQHLQISRAITLPSSPSGQEELDEALELVRQAVGEAREVIPDLRPTVLDDFGLAAAIRLQVETLRSEGLGGRPTKKRWGMSACQPRWRRRFSGSPRRR